MLRIITGSSILLLPFAVITGFMYAQGGIWLPLVAGGTTAAMVACIFAGLYILDPR